VASYFNRDNVALPGFRDFFKAASEEERTHAQQLKDYQACQFYAYLCRFKDTNVKYAMIW